jgi:probable addiction module antidote protein
MTKTRQFREFSEILKERLKKNPELAVAYLNETLKNGDKKVFLLALRDVIEAQGSITEFAEEAGVSRQSIYRMLSENGNPTYDNLAAIFEAMGFQIQLKIA